MFVRNDVHRENVTGAGCLAVAVTAVFIVSVLSCAIPVGAFAAGNSTPLGASTFSDRFGVADSHLPLHDSTLASNILTRMQQAGAGWVRCAFAWSDMQPFEGQPLNFVWADRAVNGAQSHGVKVLGILGAAPSWANGGNWPNYPPDAGHTTQWQAYVSAVCARYKGKVSAWEIWNEENINAFWQPTPDASAYTALVAQTEPYIRTADPAAKVVMGGLAGLGSDFLDACLKAGIADHVDAVAYHPYVETLGPPTGYTPKERLCRFLVTWVRSLIAQYTTKPLEVWLTEFGWTTCTESPPGVSEDTQASYMLRSLINYADTDADRVIWYNIFDEESGPADHNGLLHNDLTAKPSFNYFKTFQSVFGGATSSAPAVATYSCSSPDTLEAHSFNLPDGSLAVGVWKSDDASDLLTFTLDNANYANPVTINPSTGSASATPGVSRASDGRLTVTSIAVGKRPVILKFARQATSVSWYLAEGTTAWGFETYISIENPNSSAVTADVTYMTKNGPVNSPAVNLPPMSQATVYPRDTLGSTDFSTKVTCREKRAIVVDRTMSWTGPGAASPEGHSSVGVTSPDTTWYLPEGSSSWGFECWLLIQNPNTTEATCQVTYMIENEVPKTVEHKVPASSRATFNMAEDIGAKDASIMVESNLPVIPERAMYRNNRREGHDSIGTTSPASDYYLAEGTSAWGFTTYVLIQNPNDEACDTTVTYMTGDGPKPQASFNMPGKSRKTIRVNDVAGMGNTDFSTQVHGTKPIIAERAMYWGADTPLGEACHDSIGMDQAHMTFYLPDGQTSEGRETYTLVQNPNAERVMVEITYMTPTGTGNVVKTETIDSGSRRTFNMLEHSGINGRAAIMVTSKTDGEPIMVERAMYWNSRGAGTNTIGGCGDGGYGD
jgi:Cellulase (glycosyl hydrolase family 5)